jgi:hypothetical protein
MSQDAHVTKLRESLARLSIEQLRQGLTPNAKTISQKGYDTWEVDQWPPDWHIRAEYFNLSEPCYAVVRLLWDDGLLSIIATRVGLKTDCCASGFPCEIPPVPKPSGQVGGWSLETALNLPQQRAQVYLLLWFAVSHSPQAFGKDWLYHQSLMQLLPTTREKSGLRPMNRVARWVHAAGEAIVDAVETAGRSESDGCKKRQRKRGRYQTDNDPNADEKLAADWKAAKASGTQTYADFAKDRGLDEGTVKAAVERDRKRKSKRPHFRRR